MDTLWSLDSSLAPASCLCNPVLIDSPVVTTQQSLNYPMMYIVRESVTEQVRVTPEIVEKFETYLRDFYCKQDNLLAEKKNWR
jgi:hypothetical protein